MRLYSATEAGGEGSRGRWANAPQFHSQAQDQDMESMERRGGEGGRGCGRRFGLEHGRSYLSLGSSDS